MVQTPKETIITLFRDKVRGNKATTTNTKNNGWKGHWLETTLGIQHNKRNAPDLHGYEIKTATKKVTFGDFSASEYLFNRTHPHINKYNQWDADCDLDKRTFIRIFGEPNPKKHNRYAWSGKCFPKVGEWNSCGQKIEVSDNKDIQILYAFSKDQRKRKSTFPAFLKKDNLLIAIWKRSKMENHINKKFNQKGFILFSMDQHGIFDKIHFGQAFDFDQFIEAFKNGDIILDSGMKTGNSRNYQSFRSNQKQF